MRGGAQPSFGDHRGLSRGRESLSDIWKKPAVNEEGARGLGAGKEDSRQSKQYGTLSDG